MVFSTRSIYSRSRCLWHGVSSKVSEGFVLYQRWKTLHTFVFIHFYNKHTNVTAVSQTQTSHSPIHQYKLRTHSPIHQYKLRSHSPIHQYKVRRGKLFIRRIEQSDMATYTCLAENKLGSLNFSYYLAVLGNTVSERRCMEVLNSLIYEPLLFMYLAIILHYSAKCDNSSRRKIVSFTCS